MDDYSPEIIPTKTPDPAFSGIMYKLKQQILEGEIGFDKKNFIIPKIFMSSDYSKLAPIAPPYSHSPSSPSYTDEQISEQVFDLFEHEDQLYEEAQGDLPDTKTSPALSPSETKTDSEPFPEYLEVLPQFDNLPEYMYFIKTTHSYNI